MSMRPRVRLPGFKSQLAIYHLYDLEKKKISFLHLDFLNCKMGVALKG